MAMMLTAALYTHEVDFTKSQPVHPQLNKLSNSDDMG